jgi:hypothetical protein
MAFTLGGWTKAHTSPFNIGMGQTPAKPPTVAWHFELDDQFQTTSPVAQTPAGIAFARMVVRQKGWTSGSGTQAIYDLQVAFDSGFTSNVRSIAHAIMAAVTTDQTVIAEGVVPDIQTLTFARVAITKGTDSITADIMLDFLPGM